MALDAGGFCFAWGQGPALGLAHVTLAASPQRITGIMELHVRAIAAGSMHSLALGVPRGSPMATNAWSHLEQQVWSWGQGRDGQLGHERCPSFNVPMRVSALDNMRVTRFVPLHSTGVANIK